MKELKPVLSKLNNIPNINFGGCGIAALVIHSHLEKKLGRKAKLVYLLSDYNYERYDYPNDIASAHHVAVRYKGRYIDSSGVRSKKDILSRYPSVVKVIEVTPDYLKEAVKYAPWNCTFDRTEAAPYLAEIDPSVTKLL